MNDALEKALTEVMNRFHDSFLTVGANLAEDKVRFREREDFSAPLVTVLGHTYGLRLAAGASGERPFVEASVNVYDDEFALPRFKEDLAETYEWSHVSRIVRNFSTEEDEDSIGGEPKKLASLFQLDPATDVEVSEKSKEVASIVTGRHVDRILQVRYRIDEKELEAGGAGLFASGAYLYCLRPFAAAYRKSLATSP